jgi:hypothetical protein
LWESINKRRAKIAKKEQGTVKKLWLSIGAMKADDTTFLLLNSIEDSDIDEDLDDGPQQVDIQYSQTCNPASPPLVRTQIASAKSWAEQTSRPQQVLLFLQICMESGICEWYNTFSQEHYDYLCKFLKPNTVEGTMYCYEKWECLDDDMATWPSLKHRLPPKMYGPGFDKKLFHGKVPEKNKYPPEGDGRLPSLQLTTEEAHEARFRRHSLVAQELNGNQAASASLPAGTVPQQQQHQVYSKTFGIYNKKRTAATKDIIVEVDNETIFNAIYNTSSVMKAKVR